MIQTIFTLPFVGRNFFRGITVNDELAFGKDAAYQVMKAATYNWRKLMLILATRLFTVFDRLTGQKRESVLIIDDSPYDRSRSKKVELLSRVYDHSAGRFIRGFRMLTICWSDGASCLPVDFCLLSSKQTKNRHCESRKRLDKRFCAYQRRKEATEKATAHLQKIVKRALAAGTRAQYILMDSWFTMPATLIALNQHLPVIGMVKKSSNVYYGFQGHRLSVLDIYRRLKKDPAGPKFLPGPR